MSSKKQKINPRSKQRNRRSAKRETERERMERIEKERKALTEFLDEWEKGEI